MHPHQIEAACIAAAHGLLLSLRIPPYGHILFERRLGPSEEKYGYVQQIRLMPDLSYISGCCSTAGGATSDELIAPATFIVLSEAIADVISSAEEYLRSQNAGVHTNDAFMQFAA